MKRRDKKGEHIKKEMFQNLECQYILGKNGRGFLRNKDLDITAQINNPKKFILLSYDLVIANLKKTGLDEYTANIQRVSKRDRIGFLGTLRSSLGAYSIKPLYTKETLTVFIPPHYLNNAEPGNLVFVEILKWSEKLIGKVTKIYPKNDEREARLDGLAREKGFSSNFPDDVLREANMIADRGIQPGDKEGRIDMRTTPTFTIDPDTAKDFDDALSLEELPDGNFQIGIHIADVSHYVRPHSALDKEASLRSLSVYLVDRTIPMLPHALSNDLCSLNPSEDRLAFSVIITVTPDGDILKNKISKTIIQSDHRFTYKEAEESLKGKFDSWSHTLTVFYKIAKKWRTERMNHGALMLESSEYKIDLDENGIPISIHPKEHLDVHWLIEEFMLQANLIVAEYLSHTKHSPFSIFRIHPTPREEKTKYLRAYLKALGHEPPIRNGIIPNTFLNSILAGENEEISGVLSLMIARSMEKAIYSTKNVGHYGLGFEKYTHFTSPIRRYPDLLIHRLIEKSLKNEPLSAKRQQEFEEFSIHSNNRERDAQQAEFASIKIKQVEFLASKIGLETTGIITNISPYGLFLTEGTTGASGFARFAEIRHDHFEYDRVKNIAHGLKTRTIIHIGDTFPVQIKKSDTETNQIDFKIIFSKKVTSVTRNNKYEIRF